MFSLAVFVLTLLLSAMGQQPSLPVPEANPISAAAPVTASDCSSAMACDACTKMNTCVWCASDDQGAGSCIPGGFFGPSTGSGFNGNCAHHWNYGQCTLSGVVVFIMIGSAAGVIVLVVLGCLCRCLCCTGRRGRVGKDADLYVPLADNRVSTEGESLHPKTDARRREMEEKYGADFGSRSNSVALDSRFSKGK